MKKQPKTDSLKNQSENFNENFTQEKEQIIIDGVEVLKEKINMCFILLLNKLETPETIEQTIYEHLDAFVKEWNTQLARKTQECESLKEEIEILKDNFDTATRDCNELIEELRQECEELKGKYKNVLDLAKQNADANEYCLQELEQENYRYRKALEEIEVTANKAVDLPCVFSCDCNNCAEKPTKNGDTCIQGAIFKIADIIKKVKKLSNNGVIMGIFKERRENKEKN